MSYRLEKINELIRQKLSIIIRKELEFPQSSLLTITKVETSPDLKFCKVFITVLPEHYRGTTLEILRKNRSNLRKLLQKEMTTKFIPNFNFLIDEQEVFATEVDKLLDEINK
ncbi:MAG: 30S ribosome-binding factor RbfA [Candidatus Parcubacteria bacterium]|nr:30S ribosome-binding factor RbfA [Candidatus Parcubacteria bacterium]